MGQWTTNTYRLPDNINIPVLKACISVMIVLQPDWDCEATYTEDTVVLHGNEPFANRITFILSIVCETLGIPMLERISSEIDSPEDLFFGK